nr:glycosyltransferase family 2 protein [uncultured Butyrivibrio sp.]
MADNEVLISVVVPIYNTKEYLSECIDSIINQTYRNLEIILVDDGSSDGSESICDDYAQKDRRVKVIHRDNQGLVSARREGARTASSKWVSYVDSDDWIEKNMFEAMASVLDEHENADIIIGGSFHDKINLHFMHRGVLSSGIYEGDAVQDVLPRMIIGNERGDWGIEGSAWGKIYNRNILLPVLDKIDDRITYGEDDALVYGMLPRCNSIVVMEDCYYHYRIHSGSMATSYSTETYERLRLLKSYFEREFKEIGIWEQQKAGVHKILFLFLMQTLKAMYDLDMGYQFPFGLVDKECRIVLYGAGVIGKCYYNSLRTAGYSNLVLWTDKNYSALKEQGYPVESPEDIMRVAYDYVVVAIEGKQNYEQIKDELIALGVSEDQILWEAPRLSYV